MGRLAPFKVAAQSRLVQFSTYENELGSTRDFTGGEEVAVHDPVDGLEHEASIGSFDLQYRLDPQDVAALERDGAVDPAKEAVELDRALGLEAD